MKALKVMGNLLFSVYCIGFLIAALVFNWQYARSAGFLKWLFLGEVVSTAKAVIWPYYAISAINSPSGSRKLTDQQKLDLAHFRNSIELRNQALAIIDPPGRRSATWNVSWEDQQLALNLLHRSLTESRKVSTEALSLLHEDLPDHYENEFRRGLTLFIGGLEKPDAKTTLEGQRLLREFGDWYTENLKV